MTRVRSGDVRLAVREYDAAAAAGPEVHVVLVHGYPDDQRMWVPVAERLAATGLHVVTYDVRGAGSSDVPAERAGYRVERLVDDLVAVLGATVPDRARVHLVGHDWGSVQLWEAVLGAEEDPRLAGRVASFTSVSGPALEHVGHLLRHPAGRRLRLLRQLGHSWYVGLFQLPVLPEVLWRAARPWDARRARNGANGVNLYRANVLRRGACPTPRRTDVPVLVVAPRRDPFLTPVTLEDLDRWCSDVQVVRADTGHWLPREDPDLLASLVREHVRSHS